jgi:CTD kinase subunit alpha
VPRSGRSRSPVRDREFRPSPDRRPRSPTDDYSDRDSRYRSRTRSLSRHSARSVASKASAYSSHSRRDDGVHSNRPIKSVVNDHGRPLSPVRRIPNLNGSSMSGLSKGQGSMRDAFPMHEMRPADVHNKQPRRPSRPDLEPGPYPTSPNLKTPTRSHHGSPQPESPDAGRRGGWKGVSG